MIPEHPASVSTFLGLLENPLPVSETNDFGADDIPVGAPIRLGYDPEALLAMAD